MGIGARWTVTAQPELNGIRIKQTTAYEVTAIEGSVWTLATRLEQGADEQDVSMPGMPPGLKVHLKSLKSTGAGTIVMDPSRLVPQKGKVQVSSEGEMRLDMGPQPQTMQTSQKLTIEIVGKAAAAEAEPAK